MATRKETAALARKRMRQIVKLYGDGTRVSFADIAERLGVSRQRVQKLYSIARERGYAGTAGGEA